MNYTEGWEGGFLISFLPYIITALIAIGICAAIIYIIYRILKKDREKRKKRL